MALNDELEKPAKIDRNLPEQFDMTLPVSNELDAHQHTGTDALKIKVSNLSGRRTILSSVASGTARTFLDELKFYTAGGTDRVYAYIDNAWNKIYDSFEYNLLTGGNETSLHSHAGSGSSITFLNTEVFNATSPTDWTDLNLSAQVGNNNALVMLSIDIGSSVNPIFRTKGDALTPLNSSTQNPGVAGCTRDGYVIVKTDSNGIIEWWTTSGATVVIKLIAYIK